MYTAQRAVIQFSLYRKEYVNHRNQNRQNALLFGRSAIVTFVAFLHA